MSYPPQQSRILVNPECLAHSFLETYSMETDTNVPGITTVNQKQHNNRMKKKVLLIFCTFKEFDGGKKKIF